MTAKGFEEIEFVDSYLLGWEREGERLTLFTELPLTSLHPQFEPYDRRKEHGCYKLARIVASGCRAVRGLPSASKAPEWSSDLPEFEDVGSIYVLEVQDGRLLIDWSQLEAIEIEAAAFEVIIDGPTDPADRRWPT